MTAQINQCLLIFIFYNPSVFKIKKKQTLGDNLTMKHFIRYMVSGAGLVTLSEFMENSKGIVYIKYSSHFKYTTKDEIYR